MIDVNWDENAKEAAREFACYIGKAKDCERYFEHITPKGKTVADAVEQEGEKWTHTHLGEKCRILIDKPDRIGDIVILTEVDEYHCVDFDEIEVFKPTISESDAKALELFANKSHRHGVAWAVKEYLDGHNII